VTMEPIDLPVNCARRSTLTVNTNGGMQLRGFLMSSGELITVSASKRAREESDDGYEPDAQVPTKVAKTSRQYARTRRRTRVSQDGKVSVSMSSSYSVLL
jgi:hypothetical protein